MTIEWPSWVDPLPFPFPELHNTVWASKSCTTSHYKKFNVEYISWPVEQFEAGCLIPMVFYSYDLQAPIHLDILLRRLKWKLENDCWLKRYE